MPLIGTSRWRETLQGQETPLEREQDRLQRRRDWQTAVQCASAWEERFPQDSAKRGQASHGSMPVQRGRFLALFHGPWLPPDGRAK